MIAMSELPSPSETSQRDRRVVAGLTAAIGAVSPSWRCRSTTCSPHEVKVEGWRSREEALAVTTQARDRYRNDRT
jgi:hypothetical protein